MSFGRSLSNVSSKIITKGNNKNKFLGNIPCERKEIINDINIEHKNDNTHKTGSIDSLGANRVK